MKRTASKSDVRAVQLSLSAAGRKAFQPIEAAARKHIGELLSPLAPDDVGAVTAAMGVVQRVFAGAGSAREPYRLRQMAVGDIGWITHRQAVLYTREYGWDQTYEVLVAQILAGFVKNFDERRERSWIAERDGQVIGSVFLMRKTEHVAQLRLLYVEPSARGLGLGRRLVDEDTVSRAPPGTESSPVDHDRLVSARRSISVPDSNSPRKRRTTPSEKTSWGRRGISSSADAGRCAELDRLPSPLS